jgi:hypothetical protein
MDFVILYITFLDLYKSPLGTLITKLKRIQELLSSLSTEAALTHVYFKLVFSRICRRYVDKQQGDMLPNLNISFRRQHASLILLFYSYTFHLLIRNVF